MSGIPTTNFKAPILSPSLNEFSEASVIDESGNQLEVFAVVQLDASAHSNLGSAVVGKGHASQVTARQQSAVVTTPSGAKLRLAAMVSLDSSGNPIPLVAGSAASVSGKFQSAVRVATGASESIAHGLGVVPSLVLVSVYDDTNAGVLASGYAVVEGAHDATNLKVTVTANAKYKIIAFA